MINGLLDLSWVGLIVAALLMTHVTISAVTIFLHRHQAHRALDLHPAVSHFFRFWLWLTTGMITREWVAVHRKHHAKCETPDDPHSPQMVGINKVLWEGAELYRVEASRGDTLETYGRSTPDDWLERNLYARHNAVGVVLMLLLDLALFGVAGITVWAVQMIWIPFFAAGVINGLGHWFGYRNYASPDAATNISPWGIVIGGEELHNNHHAYPSSAKFSARAGELDIGWLYIRALSALGLARVKKVAPAPIVVPGKQQIDLETVRAVIVGRLHVLRAYAREVVLPVIRAESARVGRTEGKALRRVRRLIERERSLLDAPAHATLERALDGSQNLRTVVELRTRLTAVWDRSATTHEHLKQALHDWCVQAEASGIEALSRFAATLRGYSLTTVPAAAS